MKVLGNWQIVRLVKRGKLALGNVESWDGYWVYKLSV